MKHNILALESLQATLWLVMIALLLCMVVVPFLNIDRNYNISLGFSTSRVVTQLQSPAIASALINSVILSVIASLFAIVCGSIVTHMLSSYSKWIMVAMIVLYSINPVARALSYFDLFETYTPLYDISGTLFGEKFSRTILLPALILGIHYLPIYLLRSLFVVGRTKEEKVSYTPFLNALFVQIPPWVKGFPISFALFFLLTFFDYWVIQVISGNTILYWTPLFVQKALGSRALNEAALMIDIGLLATCVAYCAATLVQMLVRLLWRMLRPLWFMTEQTLIPFARYGTYGLYTIVGLFIFWPWIHACIRFVRLLATGHSFIFIQGASRSILVMVVLGFCVAVVSGVLGFVCSALFQTRPKRYRWWLPALYVLALMPDAAYVLFSLFVTGSGIIRGNVFWVFFLLTSFSIPMAFFVWESVWGEQDRLKLFLLGSSLQESMGKGIALAFREWRGHAVLVFLLIFWLTIDNVFITDFAAGPKWKPLSAVIFNATKRGFSDAEFFTSIVSAGVVSLCVLGTLFLFSRTTKKISA